MTTQPFWLVLAADRYAEVPLMACQQTIRCDSHLRAVDSASQHLKQHNAQAPHIIGSIIHDRGRQVGDGCYELRRAVLWCAVLIQQVLCKQALPCDCLMACTHKCLMACKHTSSSSNSQHTRAILLCSTAMIKQPVENSTQPSGSQSCSRCHT